MTKRIKICGYVEIPDHMTADEFYDAVNGADMYINDHDLTTFKLHLRNEEKEIRPKEVSDNGMERWVCACGNLMYKRQKYCDECGAKFADNV